MRGSIRPPPPPARRPPARPRAHLGHREDVDDLDRVLVHELAEHKAHHLERDARAPVLEHLEERERGDVHRLSGVLLRRVARAGAAGAASHPALVEEALEALHRGGACRSQTETK
jgi:hypothetical protein